LILTALLCGGGIIAASALVALRPETDPPTAGVPDLARPAPLPRNERVPFDVIIDGPIDPSMELDVQILDEGVVLGHLTVPTLSDDRLSVAVPVAGDELEDASDPQAHLRVLAGSRVRYSAAPTGLQNHSAEGPASLVVLVAEPSKEPT
jgi:hypothetical protein